MFKCPGSQNFSQPHPEPADCPFCGAEVEFWSDEVKAKCPSCKRTILREGGASCLEWCKYAKECVGDEIYKKYLKNKKEGEKNAKQENDRKPKRPN